MMKKFPTVFLSTAKTSVAIKFAEKKGQVRKIAPRLYTSNMKDSPAQIVSQNRWQILDLLVPGGVISHRSALERSISPDGKVYVTNQYQRKIELPGLVIAQIKGPGPVEGDMPMLSFHISSHARAFLENLSPSRAKGGEAKILPREDIERKLADLLRTKGEEELNSIRDESRKIARELGFEKEQKKLDQLIGALMGTRTAKVTDSVAVSYIQREPYDPNTVEKVDILQRTLSQSPKGGRGYSAQADDTFYNQGFFDAYFSNYIEGTKFEVSIARDIVSSGTVPFDRPSDGHDILGTYQLVASLEEMTMSPRTVEEFMDSLVHRHEIIMVGRPDKRPGEFKEKKNFAGQTEFVAPDLVEGTLSQCFEICNSLSDPFARAIVMAFLITEVHPFYDGNGRTARAAMNAELIAGEQTRIIVPSVFRSEYLQSLKRLTKHSDPTAFIRVMDYLQEFVSRIGFSNQVETETVLRECLAFEDPDDAVRLKMPPLPKTE
jgi:hypothetical protein